MSVCCGHVVFLCLWQSVAVHGVGVDCAARIYVNLCVSLLLLYRVYLRVSVRVSLSRNSLLQTVCAAVVSCLFIFTSQVVCVSVVAELLGSVFVSVFFRYRIVSLCVGICLAQPNLLISYVCVAAHLVCLCWVSVWMSTELGPVWLVCRCRCRIVCLCRCPSLSMSGRRYRLSYSDVVCVSLFVSVSLRVSVCLCLCL